MGKLFTLFSGMTEYFYNEFIPLAMKIKKKAFHDEGSVGLDLENSMGGLRGEKKNSRLRTQHYKKQRQENIEKVQTARIRKIRPAC